MQRLEGKRVRLLCAAALVMGMLLGASRLQAYRAQQATPVPTPPQITIPNGTATSSNASEMDPLLARQQELRLRMAEEDRHKRMVNDADKLLELATELKTDVDKSTKNETPVAALRKAEEIERLAHDVKERLKN